MPGADGISMKSPSLNELLQDPCINNIIDSCLEEDFEDLTAIDEIESFQVNKDGEMHFHISEDKMEVYGTFYPPCGTGKELSDSKALECLTEMKILSTLIDIEDLSGFLYKANEQCKPIENVIVARGIQPVPRFPAHVELLINPEQYTKAINNLIQSRENKDFDYKKISQICILEMGTPVGHRIEEKSGISGMDVFGSIIPYQTTKIDRIAIGKNLKLFASGDIITTIDGEFVLKDNEIFINEVLSLNEGVSFKTGNINFPGTVIIKGEIEDDFSIRTGGNLYVYNSLAASEINCGANLFVMNGGIIGRKKKKVVVKGQVETVHIETVHLEAEKGIHITKSSLNSELFTNGKVSFGSRGKMIGGEVYTKDGLHINRIGSETAVDTGIFCGMNYNDVNALILLKKYRFQLVEAMNSVKVQKDPEGKSKLERQILKCDMSLEHILKNTVYNENARVFVSGTVYPGTTINICHVKFNVKEPLKNGFFFLDKQAGEVRFSRTSLT